MSKDIIWVAMKDGTGWASSRTRDEVDVAFTIIKTGGHGNISVIVRQPINDSNPTSRARRCIGSFTYETVDEAKAGIKNAMTLANAHSNKQDARNALVSEMLTHSNPNPNSYCSINDTFTTQSSIGITISHKHVVVPETTTVDSSTTNSKLEEWTKLVNSLTVSFTPELSDAFDMDKAVEVLSEPMPIMTEIVEEVQTVVESVFNPDTWSPGDPVPNDYMLVGGRPVKMEWPK